MRSNSLELSKGLRAFFNSQAGSANQTAQGSSCDFFVIFNGKCSSCALFDRNHMAAALPRDLPPEILEHAHDFASAQRWDWRHLDRDFDL